jgi:hypothetical protein
MQQLFSTRNISVRDFEEWRDRGELVLAPKFQRRTVWNPKAKSYLIDTILRGKPIPKLYMRQDVDPKTRRTTREIVDGQQRLHTVLTFVKNEFKIIKAQNEEFGGKFFSGIGADAQRDLLRYEFVVDLLQDMPDNEVYDVFARINTYSERLKPQELRNAKWFGEFKSSTYLLSKDFVGYLAAAKVFSARSILRMAEAEFISELLLAIHEGIREGKKSIIDNAYKNYDDDFPGRKLHERRFRETMDAIGAITDGDLSKLKFRATRLFYPLFCAVYHLKYGLPRLSSPRVPIKVVQYPKLKTVLEQTGDLIDKIKAAEDANERIDLSAEDRRFYDAFNEHWVHADKRTVLTQYLCRHFVKALR